jgi:hypothetical protein
MLFAGVREVRESRELRDLPTAHVAMAGKLVRGGSVASWL